MKVRYGILKHSQVDDRVLVMNPNYGEGVGEYGSRPVKPEPCYIRKMYPFYEELEESVLKEGFRNPIHCLSVKEGTFAKYGTSRLWIAKKHRLDIPCIISDFVDEWKDLEELKTKAAILKKFTDNPEVFEFKKGSYLRIDKCPNV